MYLSLLGFWKCKVKSIIKYYDKFKRMIKIRDWRKLIVGKDVEYLLFLDRFGRSVLA